MGFFRPDASVLFQRDDVSPFFLCNGVVDLPVVVSTVGKDEDLMGIMRTKILLQIQVLDVLDDGLVFGPIADGVFSAIPSAIEWYWRQGNDRVMEKHNDVGPLVPDDIPLAVVESFGIVRVQS